MLQEGASPQVRTILSPQAQISEHEFDGNFLPSKNKFRIATVFGFEFWRFFWWKHGKHFVVPMYRFFESHAGRAPLHATPVGEYQARRIVQYGIIRHRHFGVFHKVLRFRALKLSPEAPDLSSPTH